MAAVWTVSVRRPRQKQETGWKGVAVQARDEGGDLAPGRVAGAGGSEMLAVF